MKKKLKSMAEIRIFMKKHPDRNLRMNEDGSFSPLTHEEQLVHNEKFRCALGNVLKKLKED